ncbi:ABC transporter ATP-binding protein [Paraburkholderia xenovorans]|uniref:ABC transporter ATP-binding protein n=1 Tax=Paraburkholderia xenovorans TaxID=36873 RepID=UPI001558FEF4|nr:ABC transporter ATP-binding protein [Paraburkholderia xenovorans]NPT38499.1 ATP-binding cassette domain-containing protein [Paraburkholderia xenovorans]
MNTTTNTNAGTAARAIAATVALEVRNLGVAYGAINAVSNLNLRVRAGEAVAVIGSNGAGKTSFLKAVMGLVPAVPSSSIECFGVSLHGMPAYRRSKLGIGYVPEGRELFGGLTVMEELMIGARLLPSDEQSWAIDRMFTMFPRLGERRRQVAGTLSGGEQQMVAIARTVIGKPRLLLLDEPSLGLAPVIQDTVYETLAQLRAGGLPILLVEQNAYRALKLCELGYVIELGHVTRSGESAELLADPSIQSAYLGT